MFVRRYMCDRVHRLREDQVTTYCNREVRLGERLRNPPKIGRCSICVDVYRRESAPDAQKVAKEPRRGDK